MNEALLSAVSLEGRTALVTGGSRGIGRTVCLTLARAGAFVAVNYRGSEDAAKETLRLVQEQAGDGILLPFDVRDAAAVEKGISQLLNMRGAIEILVNNAGISKDGLLGRMKDQDWNDVLETNLSGAFHLCRTVSKTMIRNRRGRIINIASTAGEAGNAGQANYSAAKAGLIGLTKSLARELASRNVRVNAIAPGYIQTEMTAGLSDAVKATIVGGTPLGRMGTPDDVAQAVAFLSSDAAAFITGTVLPVDGGLGI